MLVSFFVISLSFVGVCMGAWIFPHAYFSELVLSFLPYSIVISIFGLLYSFVLFSWESRKKTKIKSSRLFLLIFSMVGYLVV
jgi:hypothetical protein